MRTWTSVAFSALALAGLLLLMAQPGHCQLFRFCHRGVFHQILENDCPYGLLFNEQLQIPCFYTMNTPDSSSGGSGNVPRIWPTLCEDSYLFIPQDVTDETVGDGFFLAKKNGELRMIQFTSPGNDSNALANTGDLVSFQSCEDRCYRNIFEDTHSSILYTSSSHEESDSLETPHQISRPKLSPEEASSITDQTLRLGDYLFEQIGNPDENPGPKLRITELFKRSIKILSKSCQHPFISSNFVNRVLYGFLFLVADSGIGEIEDISVEEFEEIMVALNGCDEKSPDFRLEGVVCESNAIVKEVIKILANGTEYSAPFQLNMPKTSSSGGNPDYDISPDEGASPHSRGHGSFPYDELDVFTEAAWSAVQVTHATCFATFKPNVNMHHRYVSAMEQLFNWRIQDRWRNPTVLTDPRMWGTWFLADVDLAFVNLQACIRAAYLDAPFTMRLDRPIDPVRSRGPSPRGSMSSSQRAGGGSSGSSGSSHKSPGHSMDGGSPGASSQPSASKQKGAGQANKQPGGAGQSDKPGAGGGQGGQQKPGKGKPGGGGDQGQPGGAPGQSPKAGAAGGPPSPSKPAGKPGGKPGGKKPPAGQPAPAKRSPSGQVVAALPSEANLESGAEDEELVEPEGAPYFIPVPKQRKKRNAESDMDSYWESYHASGGIRYRLANSIQCFQNPDDRDAAVQLLKDQCAVNAAL